MRRLLLVLMVLALAGCASLDVGTANRLRALDYLNDKLPELLIAFDLPYGVQPVEGKSTLHFDIGVAGGERRQLNAVLDLADADEAAGTLPPPHTARVYFLFGFSGKDKAALYDLQVWARTLPPGTATVNVSLSPAFCSASLIDPAKVNVSVLVALPGDTSLAPLVDRQPLSEAMKGGTLALCQG
ncbi:MAG: hypothetical protein ABL879_01325 [Devosia sp.]